MSKQQKYNTNLGKLQVTTSIYPLYFFTTQIGGIQVAVKNITPAGAEPHDYEPSTQDLATIENSKLLILNGENLESWAKKISNEVEQNGVKVITVGEGFVNNDPHIWLSPNLAKKEVENILEGIIAVDRTHEQSYTARAQSLLQQLDELDTKYRAELSRCHRKDFITSHAAFGYLARDYGLNQVSIAGLSPDEEPSPKQLAAVSQFAKEHEIKYIFFEKLVSPRFSETLAHEVGAQTLVLDPLEGVPTEDIQKGVNYFTVMEQNLTNLKTSLECQ